MTDHVKTILLEKWLLSPDSLESDEAARIERHVKLCVLCRDDLASLRRVYEFTESNLQSPPSEQDRQAAERILPRKPRLLQSGQMTLADRFEEILTPPQRSMARRAMRIVMDHPIRVAGAGVFALGALTLVLLATHRPVDGNPSFARVKDEQLSVYNQKGDVLWNKPALGIIDGTNDNPFDTGEGSRVLVRLADVDGDGTTEVLLNGTGSAMRYKVDSLYCLNADGKPRWTTGMGRLLPPLVEDKGLVATPNMMAFAILRSNPNLPPRIFAVGANGFFSWSKLIEIDPSSGAVLGSFYNRGHLTKMAHLDLDHDGKEELILGGVNDGFNRGCVVVFDPDSVRGLSPAPEAIGARSTGSEKEYLLFPVTRVQKMLGRNLYGFTKDIIGPSENGRFTIRVGETISTPSGAEAPSLFYLFGPDLRVERVTADDTFMTYYERLLREGRIEPTPMPDYLQSLRDSLLYWNGSGFQHFPRSKTMLP